MAGGGTGGESNQGGAFPFTAHLVPLKHHQTPSERCKAVSLKAPWCSVKVQQKLDHQDINLLFSLE